jgi:hypothetical protein
LYNGNLKSHFVLLIGQNKRHSIYRKLCRTKDECDRRVKAFITFLYNHLFNFMLSQLNALINRNSITSSKSVERGGGDTIFPAQFANSATLSLLDLYGFENLQFNHLEQMCINYANERLQQLQISTLKKYFVEEKSLSEVEILNEPTELNRVEIEIEMRIDDLHCHVFSILDEVLCDILDYRGEV